MQQVRLTKRSSTRGNEGAGPLSGVCITQISADLWLSFAFIGR